MCYSNIILIILSLILQFISQTTVKKTPFNFFDWLLPKSNAIFSFQTLHLILFGVVAVFEPFLVNMNVKAAFKAWALITYLITHRADGFSSMNGVDLMFILIATWAFLLLPLGNVIAMWFLPSPALKYQSFVLCSTEWREAKPQFGWPCWIWQPSWPIGQQIGHTGFLFQHSVRR